MNNINLEQLLIKRCTMRVSDFCTMGTVIDTPAGSGQLIHIDNNASILGVAHLDHVMYSKPKMTKTKIQCPQLDDRLGVWVLLDLLQRMDCVPFDILLTDDEEKGQSTGQYFKPERQYNWIFSFDRANNGVVMYDYEDSETSEIIKSYNFDVEHGTYSDISLMKMNCKGFNFGTGYHKQHTQNCYANLKDTIANASKFMSFANSEYSTKLEHDHSNDISRLCHGYGGYYNRHYGNYNNKYGVYSKDGYPGYNKKTVFDYCDSCAKELETTWFYCPYCGTPSSSYVTQENNLYD